MIAIVEGGLRFPLSPFLHRFLVQNRVAPSQLSSNVYRIINGMLKLNRRLGINLGHTELDYCYTVCNVGRDTYKIYLRVVDKSREIVKCIPSSSKGVNDVRLWVTGP